MDGFSGNLWFNGLEAALGTIPIVIDSAKMVGRLTSELNEKFTGKAL